MTALCHVRTLKMTKIQSKLFQSFVLLLLPSFILGDEQNGTIPAVNSKNRRRRSGNYSQEIKTWMEKDTFFLPEEEDDTPTLEHQGTYRREIPRHFDARENWPECRRIIDYKRNQGSCASCWANAAASVMSDRICIDSHGEDQKHISVEDIVGCCYDYDKSKPCTVSGGKCSGGSANSAFRMWKQIGYVTGGNAGSRTGCKPYGRDTFNGYPPRCDTRCTNTQSFDSDDYEFDKSYARIVYRVPARPERMQREIMNNGPIITFMNIYQDYRDYTHGIYEHKKRSGEEKIADHFVKIVGWGEDWGRPYWLIANSYGDYWGEHGMFRIIRGTNNANIESNCRTGSIRPPRRVREWIVEPPSSIGNLNNTSWLKCLYLLLLLLCI